MTSLSLLAGRTVPADVRNCTYLACNDRNAFYFRKKTKKYHAWSGQNVCDALTFLLDNIFIRFGTKLYKALIVLPWLQIYSCFVMRGGFIMSLSDDKQADVIDAFNTTSRYLDDKFKY